MDVGAVSDIGHMFSVRWEDLSRMRLNAMRKARDEAVAAAAQAVADAEKALTVRAWRTLPRRSCASRCVFVVLCVLRSAPLKAAPKTSRAP